METKLTPERMLEILIALQGSRSRAAYCHTVMRELDITSKDINAIRVKRNGEDSRHVEVENEDTAIIILRQKTVIAVYNKLRKLFCDMAIEKKILITSQQIPLVGKWKDGRIFKKLNEKNLIVTDITSGDCKSRVTWHDPLKNIDFLKLVIAS